MEWTTDGVQKPIEAHLHQTTIIIENEPHPNKVWMVDSLF